MFRLDRIALLSAAALFAACSAETPSTPGAEPAADTEQAAASPTPTSTPAPTQQPAASSAPVADTPPPPASAPDGAEVYFVSPADGDEVEGEVKVVFGLRNMEVVPAGDMTENAGHHHLLIDAPDVAMDAPLPSTEQIVHFGGGQTETTLTLAPGEHTLQLLLGDGLHRPHNPPVMSEKITITVK
jgi:hypothetical protein